MPTSGSEKEVSPLIKNSESATLASNDCSSEHGANFVDVSQEEHFPDCSVDTLVSDSEPEREYSEPERECEPLLLQRRAYKSSSTMRSGCLADCQGTSSQGLPIIDMSSEMRALWRLQKAQFVGVRWLAVLREQYGTNLLLLLFASQHVLKGIVQQLQATTVMWIFRDYHVSGPRMQLYTSISNSAWALKPIIGMVSDLLPIKGYHKAPYVIMTSMIGVACTAMIGVSTKETCGVLVVVFCLFGMSLQASTCDLLTEAKYSEHLAVKPAFGPDLLTYVWGGISVGNIIAISMVGTLIQTVGPRFVFLACLAPASAILYPTLMNYFEEKPVSRAEQDRFRLRFWKQKEVIYLGFLMSACTLLLTLVGALAVSHATQFYTAVSVLALLLPTFHMVLRPEIAKVNTFFVLQAALGISINGATFYFYTDKVEQYPEGPHFSAWFFTTTLGSVSSIMSVVGLATYNRYMKGWTYRSLILLCNVIVTVLSLLDVLMYTRLNLALGIPDAVFVLGSSVSTTVIRQWQWMPGMVVMSQLCPTGMEATMFALLAGCANIGNTIADYIGAYVLEVLHVHPTGAVNEGIQFENMWKASCLATMLPAITILLIPFFIPDAKQTDKLILSNPSSAIAGSPLSRWLATGGHTAITSEDSIADTP